MADDEKRVKRSRFDQTEPEPRKTSRFDRRSRSPSSRQTESKRSRSPLGHDPRSPASSDKRSASLDPAAAAGKYSPFPSRTWDLTLHKAVAAAKINAELQARKGIQHADVPPIRSGRISPNDAAQTASPLPKAYSPSAGQSTSNLSGEIYIADGDYIKDIEVNDLRNRYTLTKGSTQKMVNILATRRLISSGLTPVFLLMSYLYLCGGH